MWLCVCVCELWIRFDLRQTWSADVWWTSYVTPVLHWTKVKHNLKDLWKSVLRKIFCSIEDVNIRQASTKFNPNRIHTIKPCSFCEGCLVNIFGSSTLLNKLSKWGRRAKKQDTTFTVVLNAPLLQCEHKADFSGSKWLKVPLQIRIKFKF